MTVYMIGGSPCSGKSTVAEALAEKCGLAYFKVDDHLEKYMEQGAADGKKCCAAVQSMSPEQIWMREPVQQCEEELAIYREIFSYVLADLEKVDAANGVITEGAAWLPALAREAGIPAARYLSITPTKEFQVFHYRQREWVPYVLAACSDKEKAFTNWMDRDHLFAKAVEQQCAECGYTSLVNAGELPAEQWVSRVAEHFGLA